MQPGICGENWQDCTEKCLFKYCKLCADCVWYMHGNLEKLTGIMKVSREGKLRSSVESKPVKLRRWLEHKYLTWCNLTMGEGWVRFSSLLANDQHLSHATHQLPGTSASSHSSICKLLSHPQLWYPTATLYHHCPPPYHFHQRIRLHWAVFYVPANTV